MGFRQVDIIFFPIVLLGVGLYGFGVAGKLLIVGMLVFALVGYSDQYTIRPPTAKQIVVPAAIVVCYTPLSVLYGYANFSSFVVDIQFYVYFCLLILAIGRFRIDPMLDFSRFLWWLKLSLIFHILVTAFYSLTGGTLVLFDYNDHRRLQTALGPATSAIYYLAVFTPHLVSLSRHYRFLSWDALISLICFALIFLTGSRTALAASLSVVVVLVIMDKRIRLSTKSLLFGLVVILSGWIVYVNLDRIFFDDSYSIDTLNTSGRVRIWEALLDEIEQYPIFGLGHGSVNPVLVRHDEEDWRTGEDQSHNDYLKILFNTGIVGFVMFIVIIRTILGCRPRLVIDQYGTTSDLDKTIFLYTIVFLLVMITDNILVYHFFIYPYLAIVAIGWKGSHKERQYS